MDRARSLEAACAPRMCARRSMRKSSNWLQMYAAPRVVRVRSSEVAGSARASESISNIMMSLVAKASTTAHRSMALWCALDLCSIDSQKSYFIYTAPPRWMHIICRGARGHHLPLWSKINARRGCSYRLWPNRSFRIYNIFWPCARQKPSLQDLLRD